MELVRFTSCPRKWVIPLLTSPTRGNMHVHNNPYQVRSNVVHGVERGAFTITSAFAVVALSPGLFRYGWLASWLSNRATATATAVACVATTAAPSAAALPTTPRRPRPHTDVAPATHPPATRSSHAAASAAGPPALRARLDPTVSCFEGATVGARVGDGAPGVAAVQRPGAAFAPTVGDDVHGVGAGAGTSTRACTGARISIATCARTRCSARASVGSPCLDSWRHVADFTAPQRLVSRGCFT